jgi:hypothetical protein
MATKRDLKEVQALARKIHFKKYVLGYSIYLRRTSKGLHTVTDRAINNPIVIHIQDEDTIAYQSKTSAMADLKKYVRAAECG